MIKPFWARVVTNSWVGRFEVSSQGIILFAPPIAIKYKGKKWIDMIRALFLARGYHRLVEYQIFYDDKIVEEIK